MVKLLPFNVRLTQALEAHVDSVLRIPLDLYFNSLVYAVEVRSEKPFEKVFFSTRNAWRLAQQHSPTTHRLRIGLIGGIAPDSDAAISLHTKEPTKITVFYKLDIKFSLLRVRSWKISSISEVNLF